MLSWLSRCIFYPLWDRREGNLRLKTMRSLEASQWRDHAAVAQEQWRHLRAMLQYAYAHCPHYRATFDAHGVTPGEVHTPDDLRRIPLLSKSEVQRNIEGLISREFGRGSLVEARTGGSTGTSLTIYCDPPTRERRNGAALRANRWAGWNLGERTAAIWGNPPVCDTPKKWLRNFLHDRTFYLDTMNLTESTLRTFASLCQRYRPPLIFGHAHSIYIFARFVQEAGIRGIHPRAIISTSMTLLEPERALIERVLGCAVTNRYGCEEVGLIACECERHAGLHINAEHVFVEFVAPDGTYARPGEEAELVVTDLLNTGMPLIRYRVGDIGVEADRRCECGRGLPLIERVTGRVADFLIRQDGSLVAGVSLVERTLTAIPGLDQMQIVQDAINHLTINVVPAPQYTAESERRLRTEFASVFGPEASVQVVLVSSLDQTASGKFRFSVCNVREGHPAYAG
jgi:phenylacetate-CoA ligase